MSAPFESDGKEHFFFLRNNSAYTLNYQRVVILVNTGNPLKSVQVLLGATWALKQKAPTCFIAVW